MVGADADLTDAAWHFTSTGWAGPKATGAYDMELLTLDEASNAVVYRTALQVAGAWRAIGLVVQVDAVPAPTYLERLDSGQFDSAIVDFDVGLDPDLGPLLLSSQVGSGGSNVSGVQDKALDQLLLTVRKTVDPAARQAAVSALEKYLSTSLPILPLAFRDYDLVVSSRVYDIGLERHRRSVGSVLGCDRLAPRQRPVTPVVVCAEVAELADALVSGASGRKAVGVQIPSSAPGSLRSDVEPSRKVLRAQVAELVYAYV